MSWRREKRAVLEQRAIGGKDVQHVVGWVGRRHCGCAYMQGMRLDDHEVTFGVVPCEQHEAQTRRVLETVQLMPPQDEEMHLLWQRLLDQEIDPIPDEVRR